MDSTCSDLHIAEISEKIVEWESLVPYFSILPEEEEEIRRDHPLQYTLQKRRLLWKWKQRLGNKATYRKLRECFSFAGNQLLADEVDKLLHDPYSQSPYRRCSAEVYYRLDARLWNITIVFSKHLMLVKQYARTKLKGAKEGAQFFFTFKEECVTLQLEKINEVDGWQLRPRQYPCQVRWSDVERSGDSENLPSIEIIAYPKHNAADFLHHKVLLAGTVEDGLSFFIYCQKTSDFIDEREEMQLVRKHISEQGSLELRVVKSIFYGPPEVGKTSTRERLTGNITNLGNRAPLPSTDIEKPRTVNLYHNTEKSSVLLTESLEEWKEQDVAAQCQTLLKLIHSVQTNKQSIGQDHQKPSPQISSRPESSAQVGLLDHPSEVTPILERSPPLVHKSLPKDDALETLFKSVISTTQWTEIREGLEAFEDMAILHITDTGGQPEFHDILPLLLQGPAIFLLFLNLTKHLDEFCEISYRWEGGRRSAVYESQFTVKEMLFQLLVSVAPHSLDNPHTAVMFIGTYFDCAGPEGLRCRENELKDIIQSTELYGNIVVKDSKKNLILPLDNIGGTLDEVEKIRKLITLVIEKDFNRISLPTSWFLFHLLLRIIYEPKLGYCTLKQCEELAESCGIPANEVVVVLKYMHNNFGTVLYYSDVASLTNVVICNPNVIFKRAANLVALSFDERYCPGTSEEIRKSGEIDPCRMEAEKEKEISPFSVSHVVDLLIHYNIISLIKKSDGSHVYFMPCLLRPDPLVRKKKKQGILSLDPAPLLILFNTGYIPLGLFSALIVYLSKNSSWVLDPYKDRYRNKVTFMVDISSGTDLVLINHIDCLELRVESSAPFATVCPDVVCIVKGAIDYLKSRHKYMKFHNSLGFYCSSDLKVESGSPHPAVCAETDSPQACWDLVSPKVMRCLRKPNCATSNSKLIDKHKVWFKQYSDVSADSDKAASLLSQQPPVPHVKTANPQTTSILETKKFKGDQEMPKGSSSDSVFLASSSSLVASHENETSDTVLAIEQLAIIKQELPDFTQWRNLGLRLGLTPGKLEVIEQNYRHTDERLDEVLKNWLRRNYLEGYDPPTWNCLVKALAPINHALADNIAAKKHCKM